jgi:hypothetical protein
MRHVKAIVMVILGLTIMETVVLQVVLQAIALQVTLPGGRTGALQAPASLALGLLLGISKLDKGEIALAVRIWHHGHLDFWLDRLVGHDIEEIRLSLLTLDSPRYLRHVLST